jgi:hypothetical protein
MPWRMADTGGDEDRAVTNKVLVEYSTFADIPMEADLNKEDTVIALIDYTQLM